MPGPAGWPGDRTGRDTRHGAGIGAHAASRYHINTEVQRDTAIPKPREVITTEATIYVVLLRKTNSAPDAGGVLPRPRGHTETHYLRRGAHPIQCEYCRAPDAEKVTGSGLDVGFASVDSLSDALFGNARALNHQWL